MQRYTTSEVALRVLLMLIMITLAMCVELSQA